MNDEMSKKGAAAGAPTQRPRSPRVPVNFPVELEGQTPGGEPFQMRAEAVRVSRGGATLITEAVVALGAVVRITPPFGRALDAEVNGLWTDEADGQQRIGVKLIDPNGWFAE
ncbi:MAG: PilZ domain-containing protein [Acidobacteriota bacterium]|nr:PilZ domain-containing protein [Acidobacteriota bacterium]